MVRQKIFILKSPQNLYFARLNEYSVEEGQLGHQKLGTETSDMRGHSTEEFIFFE